MEHMGTLVLMLRGKFMAKPDNYPFFCTTNPKNDNTFPQIKWCLSIGRILPKWCFSGVQVLQWSAIQGKQWNKWPYHIHWHFFVEFVIWFLSGYIIFHFQKICKFCVLYTNNVVSIVENSTFVQDSAPQLFKHSFVRSKQPKPIKTLYLPLVFISSVFIVGDLHDLLMIYNIWSYLHMIYYEHQFLSNITRSNHFLSLLKSPNNQGVWKRPRKRWVGHRSGNRLEWGEMFVRSNALNFIHNIRGMGISTTVPSYTRGHYITHLVGIKQ